MTGQAIFDVVKVYAKRIGVENIVPHDLRRTFAKPAHKGHVALEQIQRSLGHGSIESDATRWQCCRLPPSGF